MWGSLTWPLPQPAPSERQPPPAAPGQHACRQRRQPALERARAQGLHQPAWARRRRTAAGWVDEAAGSCVWAAAVVSVAGSASAGHTGSSLIPAVQHQLTVPRLATALPFPPRQAAWGDQRAAAPASCCMSDPAVPSRQEMFLALSSSPLGSGAASRAAASCRRRVHSPRPCSRHHTCRAYQMQCGGHFALICSLHSGRIQVDLLTCTGVSRHQRQPQLALHPGTAAPAPALAAGL